jgi:aminopeptidase N
MLPTILNVVAYYADDKIYDEFVEYMRKAKTPQEEERFRLARASFRVPALLQRTIEACLNGEVRTQDAGLLLINCFGAEANPRAAWDFIKAHWEELKQKLPQVRLMFLVRAMSTLWKPTNLESDVQIFFATHSFEGGARATAQALEELSVNVQFCNREAESLANYLRVP